MVKFYLREVREERSRRDKMERRSSLESSLFRYTLHNCSSVVTVKLNCTTVQKGVVGQLSTTLQKCIRVSEKD